MTMSIVSLVLMTLATGVLLLWVFWPSQRGRLEAHADMALREPETASESSDERDFVVRTTERQS